MKGFEKDNSIVKAFLWNGLKKTNMKINDMTSKDRIRRALKKKTLL
jgi:hypothetical protein